MARPYPYFAGLLRILYIKQLKIEQIDLSNTLREKSSSKGNLFSSVPHNVHKSK